MAEDFERANRADDTRGEAIALVRDRVLGLKATVDFNAEKKNIILQTVTGLKAYPRSRFLCLAIPIVRNFFGRRILWLVYANILGCGQTSWLQVALL